MLKYFVRPRLASKLELFRFLICLFVAGLASPSRLEAQADGSTESQQESSHQDHDHADHDHADHDHADHDHAGHDHAGHDHAVDGSSELQVYDFEPKTEELKKHLSELREVLKQMREVIVDFNTNEIPSQDAAFEDKWLELEAKGKTIYEKFLLASLAEYKSGENDAPALKDMLRATLKQRVEQDFYGNLFDIGLALWESGQQDNELLGLICMAGYGEGRLEEVKEFLKSWSGTDEIPVAMVQVNEQIDEIVELWKEELEIRAQEESGEPLPRALIKTTRGNIEVVLYEDQAPETVANFISLAEQGFYENLLFHRVIQHFMAQGGCPNGDGSGGPGYRIYSEGDRPDARRFFRGTLGMAMTDEPNSAGSQFFITFLPTPHLNEGFTAFGRVTSGFDVLASLARINPEEKDESKAPVMPDEIREIVITQKRDHEYKPNISQKE